MASDSALRVVCVLLFMILFWREMTRPGPQLCELSPTVTTSETKELLIPDEEVAKEQEVVMMKEARPSYEEMLIETKALIGDKHKDENKYYSDYFVRIKELCGDLCMYDGRLEKTKSSDIMATHRVHNINCHNLFHPLLDAGQVRGPPRTIPKSMMDDFTQGGTIMLSPVYIDSRAESDLFRYMYTQASFIQQYTYDIYNYHS